MRYSDLKESDKKNPAWVGRDYMDVPKWDRSLGHSDHSFAGLHQMRLLECAGRRTQQPLHIAGKCRVMRKM